MTIAHRVGGDIDASCTRCKMILGHTILAMVGSKPARVRCNTCQGEHNFHAPASPAAAKVKTKAATTRASKAEITSLEALLAGKDISRARRYSVKELFGDGEVLSHPTFGIGIVREVRSDKLTVVFNAGTKTLVHGKH